MVLTGTLGVPSDIQRVDFEQLLTDLDKRETNMTTSDYDSYKDYEAFKEQLPTLIQEHGGKFVVFHACTLDQIFENSFEAFEYAREKYELGHYIVQEIHNRKPRPASYSLLI